MESTLIFIVLLSIIGAAQSQTWAGTYNADSSCSTSSCCCLSGKVVITSYTTNIYTVTSSVSGICVGTTFTGNAYTSGYTGWILVAGNNDTLALSSDSNTITVTNPVYSSCSGKGVKSGAIKQHSNIIILFALTLLAGLINASKI